MKKNWLLIPAAMLVGLPLNAAVTEDRNLQEALRNSMQYPDFFTMLSAFFVLSAIVIVLVILAIKSYRTYLSKKDENLMLPRTPMISSAFILGIGIGGLLEGIVFNQILQWHHMVSDRVATDTLIGKQVNVFWDGLVFLFCLGVILVGVILLWRMSWKKNVAHSGRLLSGGLLMGWGTYKIVEGVINHHILQLHDIREITNDSVFWNVSYLVTATILFLLGVMLTSRKVKYASEFDTSRNVNPV
jgi:uncharacterized membrane protein